MQHDKAYIDALRSQLRRLRAKATKLGEIDHMIEEAYDNLDVDCALYWERVAAGYVKNRKKLAKRLMDMEYAIVEAGSDVPNPHWITPFWLLQEWMASVEELSEALFGCPPEAQICYGAGKECMDEGEYRQAVEEFSKSIDSFPKMADAFIGRGIAYCILEQFERGIEDFNEAIRLEPDNAGAYCNRGLAWFELDDPGRALQDYDEAIRLEPGVITFHQNKGLLFFLEGDLVQALQCYDEALRVAPKQADTYESRADVYEQMGLDMLAEQDRARAKYLKNRRRPKTRSD